MVGELGLLSLDGGLLSGSCRSMVGELEGKRPREFRGLAVTLPGFEPNFGN